MPEGEAIEHPLVSRSRSNPPAAQGRGQRNFDIRKQLLEYDDVANDQRKVIYAQRNELLETEDISETITAMRHAGRAFTVPYARAGRLGRGTVGPPALERTSKAN